MVVSWYTAAYGAPSTSAILGVADGRRHDDRPAGRERPGDAARKLRSLLIRSASANALVWACMVLSLNFDCRSGQLYGAFPLLGGISIGIMGISIVGGVNEHAPAGEKGAIFGMMNMVTVLSAVVAQWGTGAIINRFPADVAGTYTPAGYAASFWVVVAAIVLKSVFPLFSLPRARLTRDQQPRQDGARRRSFPFPLRRQAAAGRRPCSRSASRSDRAPFRPDRCRAPPVPQDEGRDRAGEDDVREGEEPTARVGPRALAASATGRTERAGRTPRS